MRYRHVVGTALLPLGLVLGACVDGSESGNGAARSTTSTAPATTSTPSTSSTTTSVTTTTVPATTTTVAVAASLQPVLAGHAPRAADAPEPLATQIVDTEQAIRDPATVPEVIEAAGRLQQLVYRQLGDRPEWDAAVLAAVPEALREVVTRHTTARRELRALTTRVFDTLPAWRIVEPPPTDELLAHYHEAEARFGVPWEVLAAVNLVETGLGQIVGLSTAGAQGPMQFIPATWEAYGLGGDVWDTHDAVLGAANYLASNGGADGTPEGLANALRHYNHSDHYVAAVLQYTALLEQDPRVFAGFHAWQVVYRTNVGDVVLPTGYESTERIPVADWLAAHPR